MLLMVHPEMKTTKLQSYSDNYIHLNKLLFITTYKLLFSLYMVSIQYIKRALIIKMFFSKFIQNSLNTLIWSNFNNIFCFFWKHTAERVALELFWRGSVLKVGIHLYNLAYNSNCRRYVMNVVMYTLSYNCLKCLVNSCKNCSYNSKKL